MEGPRVEASRRYGASLEKRLRNSIVYHDERLTTMVAERMLVEEGNVSRKKRKQVIDMLAAVMILQNYLEFKWKSITKERGKKMTEHHDHDHEHDHLEGHEGHEHITIIDEEGNEILQGEVIFTFESDDFNKSYVLCYPSREFLRRRRSRITSILIC